MACQKVFSACDFFSQCGIKKILQCTYDAMKSDRFSDNDKTSIQVIERMVSLLDALAQHPDPVSLKELSSITSLHPSTAHRILNDRGAGRGGGRAGPGAGRRGGRRGGLGN